MKTSLSNGFYRKIFTFLTYLTFSTLSVWAQDLSSKDLKETLDFSNGTIAYTLPSASIPTGSTCSWKINGETVTTGVSADGLTLTLPLSNQTRSGEVSVSTDDNTVQTLKFDIEPKEYGTEYNGAPFYADSYATYPDGSLGDGSKEKPFLISNDLQLAKLAHDVTHGSSTSMYAGKYFKLSQDIDLSKGLWTPIGTWDPTTGRFFAGKFDGDGHTISNLRICWTNTAGHEASWGLFSRLQGKNNNEAEFAVVTNLIVDGASLEKKVGYTPPYNTNIKPIKLGIIAADMTQFAEVSNIIIRNSQLTDHKEVYKLNNSYRIGGIVGYVNTSNHRMFNISADVKIDMHAQANNNSKSVIISGGVGCYTEIKDGGYTQQPTNIYIHGPKISTNSSSVLGSVIAFYSKDHQNKLFKGDKNTLFYTPDNAVTSPYNIGQMKSLADIDATTGNTYGKNFADLANNFITKKGFDKKNWTYTPNNQSFSFNAITLKLERGTSDVLTVVDENEQPMEDTYDWYVSTSKGGNSVKCNTDKCNPFTLPRQTYDQYIYAANGSSYTNTLLVKAIGITAKLVTSDKTFTVNVYNDTEEQLTNEALGLDITYEWYNGTERLTNIPTNQNVVNRPLDAFGGHKYYCKVTVKSGTTILFEKNVSAAVVVYLCPAGVTTADGKTYAVGVDKIYDPTKPDNATTNNPEWDDWGYTPEQPMKTWKGAYKKLSETGSWDENTIVLMGTSSKDVTRDGFNLTPNYMGENMLTSTDWNKAKKNYPQLFRNTTITGKWDKDYKGQIEIFGASRGLPIWGDTRFENLTFAQNGGDSYKIIYCQYNNLDMGEGLIMKGFNVNSPDYGTIDGAVTNAIHIFGGLNNDGRFYPLNHPDSIAAFNRSMPHGREGFSITLKSGFYSCISAGGRQTVSVVTNNDGTKVPAPQNGVMGTPKQPLKCTIEMDIDREWNDQHNELRWVTLSNNTQEERINDYDAGVVLAGNHEGAMYADVDIIIESGKVARVVNGTLGAQTELTLPYNGTTYKVPCNTFMGRANILLDPANSVNNTDDYINNRVIVTELYGGSTGRGHTGNVTVNNPFYGLSTITINGGTFKILPEGNKQTDNILCGIFGAGAGGMNGIGYGDDATDTHTPDERIPYWNSTNDVMLYGPYSVAKHNLVNFHCYNLLTKDITLIDPKETQSIIEINGGEFGSEAAPIDGIYAGGSGFMSKSLWTQVNAKPSKYGGNVYGSGETYDVVASLTINNGEFYCKNGIFAGGRGTDYFYSSNAYGGKYKDYKELGKTYGNVELNIAGGIFHCAVFGGGYGVGDAQEHGSTTVETLVNMARVYGQSTVNITGGTFLNDVFGGGDRAVVESTGNNATQLTISEQADIRGSVFGGGNGERLRPATQPFAPEDGYTQHPEWVGMVLGNTQVMLTGNAEHTPWVYGNLFGGGNLAQVRGNTDVNITAGNLAGQVFGGGNGDLTAGIVTSADVWGNTHVTLAANETTTNPSAIQLVWNRLWDKTKQIFYAWDPTIDDPADEPSTEDVVYDRERFFANNTFLNPHNIYGGGNLACKVGTYVDAEGQATTQPVKGTGLATVNVQQGLTSADLLQTTAWKQAYANEDEPHFSVFGGGYGQHTYVGSTQVTAHVADVFNNNSTEAITDFDPTMGMPQRTLVEIVGGSFKGSVIANTQVVVDGQTWTHRVFGGGYGDVTSLTDNTTGQVGGNTEVRVRGGEVHGDVFGGGAGLKPLTPNDAAFEQIACVMGTTQVEIANEAKIYGNVYGGGDDANVGIFVENKPADYYNPVTLKSYSTLNQTDGSFVSYQAEGYRTWVNITGGNVYGVVYGGGKGVTFTEATHYDRIGRINGNTLVHIVNGMPGADAKAEGNTIPYVWDNVYGGCAYGTIDGNTLVHIEGGMLGNNVFGGGYGATDAKPTLTADNEVLGKKDADQQGTYANILGNTKVQVDGGTWLWNQMADRQGKKVLWTDADADNQPVCADLNGFKNMIFAIGRASSLNNITDPIAHEAIDRIKNNANTQQFFNLDKRMFTHNYNIYGGGNRACYVGTTNNAATGKAVVIVNHSPLDDIADTQGHTISMFDHTRLQGLCWAICCTDASNPQFSVFGAGFGANTRVAQTEVYVQPGSYIDDEGMIAVNGVKYRYLTQPKDYQNYVDFEKNLYNDFLTVSAEEKKLYYGSFDGSEKDPDTFRRYHASRMAWLLGKPGFSLLQVTGGGFSGYVTGNTYVETDGQLNCQNIYGGGLGAMPYGDYTDGAAYDFGMVNGKATVFIKSGHIGGNVFGGGAGIASVQKGDSFVDFPNIAHVNQTEVHIYGKAFDYQNNLGRIERTIIYGNVFGGGDVANVGTTPAEATEFSRADYMKPAHCATLVNIRSGALMSQVFAGGKGRLATQCADYTKLGGVYGNTCLIVDRPVMHYPYWDDTAQKYLSPADAANMAHPADDVNPTLYSTIMNQIFGGCKNGTVYGNTLMTIYDGEIAHGVYGGGLGNTTTTMVNGNEMVSTTSADITGCTNVFIRGGEALLKSYWRPETRSWQPASIVNGVIYSPQYDHNTLKFNINHNMYAGGNVACTVGKNTYLTLTKGLLYNTTQMVSGRDEGKNFFESDEWREIYYKVGSPHFSVFGGGYGDSTLVKGDTYVNVSMEGRGSILQGIDIEEGKEYKHFYSGYSLMDIVGGGYSGRVAGATHVIGAGGVFCRRIFGGGSYSSVNATDVEIKAIDCRDIFGGGFMGDVLKGTRVQIGDNTTPHATSVYSNADIFIHGDVYGGNDVSGYVNVALNDKGYFMDNGGAGTQIDIRGGHIFGNVYGAGNGNYLFANDRNGNTKVTVNEYYPLNPNDPHTEKVPLVYTVPMRSIFPSLDEATHAVKMVNINSWHPLTNKVNIHIEGASATDTVRIDGSVYGGGNSATVQKVLAHNEETEGNATDVYVGNISLNIGSHVRIGSVFMGCNGENLFTTSEDNDYMNLFQKLNGDPEDRTKELDLAEEIDWNEAANKNISMVYLSAENSKRPLVYPHLLDLYFTPVETDIQGSLQWNGSETGEGLTDCIIGTFCCGGNRGNMNVNPKTAADFAANDTHKKIGNVVDYTFPQGLTITEKIVGGCNNANYNYKDKAFHEGGYLLGAAHSDYPFIKLNIKNKFLPKVKNGAYVGGNVYGGCFKSGTIRGDIRIDLQSDMLANKDKEMLEKSNELFAKNAEYASLNVYGAGYGMDSYVYGNPSVVMGKTTPCTEPKMNGQKFLPCGVADAANKEGLGVSANFVYGGGQQGYVIGVTNIQILNGHVFRAVTGGSYAGYVFGSTQVKVGYPTYYHVNSNNHVSGKYVLRRTDQKHLNLNNDNGTEQSPIIKQNICLLTDEWISQGTYEDIVALDNGNGKRIEITDDNRDYYFTKVVPETPSVGWENVHIDIDEAVYGGGYSTSQGSSVLANNTTVLKFTDQYNVDYLFTSEEDAKELNNLPDASTKGFGGNTVILVGDNKGSEHITISHQDMRKVTLANGTDLYGYYYKHYDNDAAVANNNYTYRYISLQDKYFYNEGATPPAGLTGIKENVFYEYDSEGGIFGDGHLSYAQGFRSADVTGYGFAEHTINNPKILNTFQRLDIIRLEDNCLSLLGARDYTVNEVNKTPFSIARVGEVKMVANDIRLNAQGALESNTDNPEFQYSTKARNFMGFSNNIHYMGALTSNVNFYNEMWRNRNGQLATATSTDDKDFVGMSYQGVKQQYIDDYEANKNGEAADDALSKFQKRNDGTASNMIGIASGYALKVQLCQETYNEEFHKIVENAVYGPIYGVVEMNLINVREDEGGGYAYADNNHQRHAGDAHKEDFLETTGNFVFPYNKGRYIVDDCFPTGYNALTSAGSDLTVEDMKVHYWYVTGFHYYYNVHITGYTFKSSTENPLYFDSDNKDGLTVLSGLKSGQTLRIQQWKMRSGHPEDKNTYASDLEYRNYLTGNETEAVDKANYAENVAGGYKLYVGGAASNTFVGATTITDANKDTKGFAAELSMREKGNNEATLINNVLPKGLKEDAKIAFRLVDEVDNTDHVEANYFDKHMAKKSLATLVLKAPAYEEYVSETNNKPIFANTGGLYKKVGDSYEVVEAGQLDADNTYYQPQTGEFVKIDQLFTYNTQKNVYEKVENWADVTLDKDNPKAFYVPREYTYTLYLTIEYVQGPTVSGHINLENCALPGEMIRVGKDNIVVSADQSFAVNGYYWRIGKRAQNAEGTWMFNDTTPWTKENINNKVATGYDTFNQADEKGYGLFTDCRYDKTDDKLDVPAYYYMNGYGIQLGVSITGLNDILPIDMQNDDQFVVHNFHRMDPHKTGINLHLAEAIARAKTERSSANKGTVPFAEPRIYLADQSDLTAFATFIDSIGKNSAASRYGANAQFILQKDLTLAAQLKDKAYITDFAGTLHGNGHVISGVASGKALFEHISATGHIYNLGLATGCFANTVDNAANYNYHCCFAYAPTATKRSGGTPIVYRWDGTPYEGYTQNDFRWGKVAYDLNEFYLQARNHADANVLKYVYDYYANGDYQYACRADAITGKNTGITYLRTGKANDIPNYGEVETRHDKSHPIDAPRWVEANTKADGTSTLAAYVPLFNANHNGKELMNDFLFWGQSLQASLDNYPGEIASHQLSYMNNRVFRTAGYYGNTALNTFHYNAYNRNGNTMDTYVHAPSATAIDFTCKNDRAATMGMDKSGIFYPPVNDNANLFSSFVLDADVSKNLLVYTAANKADTENEAYDVVNTSLNYNEDNKESAINGHHIVETENGFATPLLHLVERTAQNENSEGKTCVNNNLCVPLPFNVTNRAWYVRKPLNYAEADNDAWEGICLPFTANKVVASLNGELTHFYGTPSTEETADPRRNIHTLHHEYWLRGLTAVNLENNVPSATFKRPGASDEAANQEGLFAPMDAAGNALVKEQAYTYANTFFVDNYADKLYNVNANPYYAEASHTYADYLPLTAEVPYLVRFPGNRYYEFDLTSAFYNELLGTDEGKQTVTFNAYANAQNHPVVIPVTQEMITTTSGNYAHQGTFMALDVDEGKVYGMNEAGSAFEDASALSTVMPFRTYMSPTSSQADYSTPYSAIINIAQLKGDTIQSETQEDETLSSTDNLIIHAIGNQRVSIKSSVAIRLTVVTAAGQLYRILDVQPGTATYSGFLPGIYVFGHTKVGVY